jgi:hypothetical protein
MSEVKKLQEYVKTRYVSNEVKAIVNQVIPWLKHNVGNEDDGWNLDVVYEDGTLRSLDIKIIDPVMASACMLAFTVN